jgi:DNA polymerase-1
MLAAWLLSPSGRGIGLKEQVWQRLGVEMTPIDALIGAGRAQTTMDRVAIETVTAYAGADADMTLRLADGLERELRDTDQWSLFAELEVPLVPVLASMERHGMIIDAGYLAAMSREMAVRLAAVQEEIYRAAGHPFNINSPKQLGAVLFDELRLPAVRRTQTGFSTDSTVLESLREQHPIAPLLLEFRQIDKLRGTYVDALPALVNPQTGRVHTSFNQTGTSTGRLSSSDPNLQNIPVRSEMGRLVRGAFVAPPGHVLLSCDYSQVELRLLAHLSEDPELIGAFHRDEDVHATTAAAIHGVPMGEVTYEQRSLAKAINFGLMYGMSDFGLAARTDLSRDDARRFIAAYFGRFRRVKEFLDETIADARARGYVQTVMGRRRYFPELRAGSGVNPSLQRAAERAAVNMPIQGSAADILKRAMIDLHQRLVDRGSAAALVLQVHDELVLEVPEEELDGIRALVVETMSGAYALRVPLKVDAAVGRNWMEIK